MIRILLVIVAFFVLFGVAAPRALHWDPLGSMAWWLTNSSPPEARLSGPPKAAHGVVAVKVEGVDQGRAEVSEAQIDGAPLEPSWSWNLDTKSMPDGEHHL